MDTQNVLATEAPSPAPITAKEKTTETPKPDAVEIPAKNAKPAKPAEQTIEPPKHPQITQQQPTKAQTGEAPGTRIAMSTAQTHAGTFAVGVTDQNFGARFAYYNDQIRQKLSAQWITSMLDSQASGHRVYITFHVGRDGSPSHVRIAQPSGDMTLDQTALSAVQRIDTFGPLPDAYTGSYVNVQAEYWMLFSLPVFTCQVTGQHRHSGTAANCTAN